MTPYGVTQVLLLAILAAVAVPAFARVAKHNHWGLFVAERAVPHHMPASLPARTNFVATQTIVGSREANESGRTPQAAGADAPFS